MTYSDQTAQQGGLLTRSIWIVGRVVVQSVSADWEEIVRCSDVPTSDEPLIAGCSGKNRAGNGKPSDPFDDCSRICQNPDQGSTKVGE